MKKIILVFTVIVISLRVIAQPITVNTSTYSVDQLVNTVLFGNGSGSSSSCAGTISNITSSTGINFGSVSNGIPDNGIGYFTNTNPAFPLTNGVILSTGLATDAVGGNTSKQGAGSFAWTGDTQLYNYIVSLGIDPLLTGYHNATKLEFDFVPLTTTMSFDFVFASEEYGAFQCDYSDAFAFFLKDVTAGSAVTNLALVPGTSTPIAVTTIRDIANNPGCPSVNPTYFGNYYPQAAGSTSPTNFNGNTVKMTASSAVIAGHTYHIKLVIADRNDEDYDSAVFLGGGSFNIGNPAIIGNGVDNGTNYTGITDFTGGNAVCPNRSRVLQAGSVQAAGATYAWTFGGVPIAGATGFTYTATAPGTYGVTITYGSGCSVSSTINVAYVSMPINNPLDLTQPTGIFNLGSNTAVVANGAPANYDISYHHSLIDAQNIANPIANITTYPGYDGEIIYVAIQDIASGSNCTDTRSFVLHLPVAVCPTITTPVGAQSACQGGNPTALSVNTTFAGANAISYVYFNAAQAGNAMYTGGTLLGNATPDATGLASYDPPALGTAGSLPNTAGTYYVYAIANPTPADPACRPFQEIAITVNPTNTVTLTSAAATTSQTVCINTPITNITYTTTGATGATFAGLPAGVTGVWNANTITISGTPTTTVGSPFNYTVTLTGGCGVVTTTGTITVNPLPTATISGTTAVCIGAPNSTITFTGANGTSPYTFTYSTDGGATTATVVSVGNTATITVPTLASAGTTTVSLISVQDSSSTSCSQLQSGTAVVTTNPTPTVTVNSPTICGGLPATVTATPGLGGTYSYVWTYPATATDPGNVSSFATTVAGTYSVVITNTVTSCVSASASGTVTFLGAPVINNPTPFVQCDDSQNNNGIYCFDLHTKDPEIKTIATQVVTYYETLTDAQTGLSINEMAPGGTLYCNINNQIPPITIYVRVVDPSTPTCYTTTSMLLVVNPLPILNLNVTDYILCDVTAPTNDGIELFDLHSKDIEIINGQTGLTVTYYDTQANAQINDGVTGVLTSPYPNTPANNQQIWYSLTNSATGCFVVGTFHLIVNPLPTVPAAGYPAITTCESPANGVGFEEFTLPSLGTFLMGQTGMQVHIYPSLANAQADTNEIFGTTYINTAPTVQTLGVRVTNALTGCFATSTMDVRVMPLPVLIAQATPYELCDDATADGQTQFDLCGHLSPLIDPSSAYTLTYYDTLTDAQTGNSVNLLPCLYINGTPNTKIIYVRAEDPVTHCFTTMPITLKVDPNPVVLTTAPKYELCDVTAPVGLEQFDLSTQNATLLNGQIGLTVTYYDTQANAQLHGVAGILTTLYSSGTQTIWYTLNNPVTNCFAVGSLDLIVNPLPTVPAAGYPAVTTCETPANGVGFEAFTLPTASTLLGGVTGMQVNYYDTLAHAQAGGATGLITSPYVNTTAFVQTLGVRVTNALTGCFATSTMDVRVMPLPVLIAQATPYELCDDATADGQTQFDLCGHLSPLIDPSSAYTLSYYPTLANAQTGTSVDLLPCLYINGTPNTQTIYVRAVDPTTGCFTTMPITLKVDPNPVVLATAPKYQLCDVTAPVGVEQFDLSTQNATLLNGQTGLTVTYYDTQANAQVHTVAGILTTLYSSGTQTIWYTLNNPVTNCFAVGSLDLIVNPLPTVPAAGYPAITTCESPANGVGFEEFTLPTASTLLGGVTGMQVDYYDTLAHAQAGGATGLITSPYVNTTAFVQTLGVRVTNALTGCFATSTMDIRVMPLPVLIAQATPYELCDDATADGQTQFDLCGHLSPLIDPSSAYTLSYYPTLANAQTGTSVDLLPCLYINGTPNTQTIYVRAVDPTTGCFTTMPITLKVDPNPVVLATAPKYQLCDVTAPVGVEQFDLSTQNATLLNGQTGLTVTYYDTQANAQVHTVAGILTTLYSSGTQTIWYTLNNPVTNCYAVGSLDLIVNPLPTVPAAGYPAITTCESPANGVGFEEFTLPTASTLLGGVTGMQVDYYDTLAHAQAGGATGLITSPYVNTTAFVQTLGVRVTNALTGCFATSTMDIRVMPLPVLIAQATPYELCDDATADGQTQFDLCGHLSPLIDPSSAYTLSYYPTLANAQTGTSVDLLPCLYINGTPVTQTIYVRAVDPTTGCFTTMPITLKVDPNPVVLATAPKYQLCDVTAPVGVEQFDLSTQNATLLNGQTGLTVTYYDTQANAQVHTVAGILTTLYSSGTQTIWYTLNNPVTNCYAVGSLDLIVNPLPTVPAAGYPAITTCESPANGVGFEEFTLPTASTLLGGVTGMQVDYYDTLAHAQAGGATGLITSPYVNTTAFVQTLGVRVTNALTGCFATSTMDIRVMPLPVLIAQATPYELCDDATADGQTQFDLCGHLSPLIDPSSAYTLSYYPTLANAQTGTSVDLLPCLYINGTPNTQTIYVRAVDPTTGCFTTMPITLKVDPNPVVLATAPKYQLCDVTAPVGVEQFDLSTQNATLLNGQTGLTVTYYDTQANAQLHGVAGILTTLYSSGTQTIWYTLTNTVTNCYAVGSLDLIVNPLPTVPAAGYPAVTTCETPANGVGFEAFTLPTVSQLFTGINGMQVDYYDTLAHAQAGGATGLITSPYVNTTAFVQTLGVRVTNVATGCFTTSTMDVKVVPLPVLVAQATPYVVCDSDTDGYATFNICTELNPLIDPSGAYSLAYYNSYADAQNGYIQDQLPCVYSNNTPFVQTLYVSATDPITGCHTIMPILLNVNVRPALPALGLPNLTMCDQDSNAVNGLTTFNLTQQNAAILALNTPNSNFDINYFESQAAALAGFPTIVQPSIYQNLTNPQTIWVTVKNKTTKCVVVGSFQLIVNTPAVINNPTPLKLCDDDAVPNNNFTTFDLTVKNNEITAPAASSNFTINYYHSATGNVNPLPINGAAVPTSYQLISPATAYVNNGPNPAVETLAVEVIDANGCKSYTTLTIKVLPVPKPQFNPPTLAAQCESSLGSGQATFDVTTYANYISNGDVNVTLHYFTQSPTDNDILTGNHEIMFPTAATVGSTTLTGNPIDLVQYIYVAVESNQFFDSNTVPCYIVVPQGFIVNPLPEVVPNVVYQVCEVGNTGFATFDLTSQQANLLGTNLPTPLNVTTPASTFTIKYYQDAAHTILISPPTAYTNLTNPQTIYFVVTNATESSHCTNSGKFTIQVNQKPIIAAQPAPFLTCDSDTSNDGYFLHDLTTMDATILGATQTAPTYVVNYYNSNPSVTPKPTAIASPTTYMAYTHLLYFEVMNTVTGCTNVGNVQLTVEQLPKPVISSVNGSNVLCVDYNSNTIQRHVVLQITNNTIPYLVPPTPGYTYQWYADGVAIPGATSATYDVPASATGATRNYTVTMTTTTTGLTCNATSTPAFAVVQSGQAVVPSGTQGYTITNAFESNQVITVAVVGWGSYEYSLDEGPRQTSPVFENVTIGLHTIYVWDTKGDCDPLPIQNVQTIDYPHYFTPNGDGINDTWNVVGLYNQPSAKIYIFDRYGKLIKQISPQGDGWDGTFNGNLLPSDDYWFTVDFNELDAQRQFKAHFSLKR